MGLTPWQRWRQRRLRRAGKRADRREERGRRQQWLMLAGPAARPGTSPPDLSRLQPLYPPSESFWADPFLWFRHGRHYLFFEEYSYAAARGRISVLELDAEGRPGGAPRPVLDEPYHLSYPYLLEADGELYMVPEKAQMRRVDLYRCTAFPERWELVRTLMEGPAIADATLFEHDGLWWLLGARKERGLHFNESLCGFHARNLLTGRWTPHPANPLVRDFSRGRPGGRVFRDEQGRLLRPAQDCVRRYGYGLALSEIKALSTTEYRERLLWCISGEAAGGWRALHHMDWQEGLLVLDAQRLVG